MSFKLLAALPLVLAACAAPAVLPHPRELGLDAAELNAPRGRAAGGTLFPDYIPHAVTRPEDWRRVNDAQAPGGASR